MEKECIPCPVMDADSQRARDGGLGNTIQRFLLCRLSFIADSEFIRITISGAWETCSDTLATGVLSQVALISLNERDNVTS